MLAGQRACSLNGKRVHAFISASIGRTAVLRLAQAEEAQDDQDDDHEADNVDDPVHFIPFCSKSGRWPPAFPTLTHRNFGRVDMYQSPACRAAAPCAGCRERPGQRSASVHRNPVRGRACRECPKDPPQTVLCPGRASLSRHGRYCLRRGLTASGQVGPCRVRGRGGCFVRSFTACPGRPDRRCLQFARVRVFSLSAT